MVLVFGWLTPVGLETETACARSLIFNGPGMPQTYSNPTLIAIAGPSFRRLPSRPSTRIMGLSVFGAQSKFKFNEARTHDITGVMPTGGQSLSLVAAADGFR